MVLELVLSAVIGIGIPIPGKKRPKVSLILSHRIIQFDYRPRMVSATVLIKNLNEQFWCPAVEFQWGDGHRDWHESDCAPFEETTEQERQAWSKVQHHSFIPARVRGGELVVEVRLYRGNKVIHKLDEKIRVPE